MFRQVVLQASCNSWQRIGSAAAALLPNRSAATFGALDSTQLENPLQETFLTVAEVAELLKVNPQTVRSWIDRGELSAVRLGQRGLRIKQSDLDHFIAGGGKPTRTGSSATADQLSEHAERLAEVEAQLTSLAAAVEELQNQRRGRP